MLLYCSNQVVKAMAASSKSKSAKYLKAIGSYSEGELTEAIDKLSSEHRRMLAILTPHLHDHLKQVNTDTIEGKETARKKTKTVTMEQKFRSAVKKITEALEKYESSDNVVYWTITFAVGTEYSGQNWEAIKAIHTNLVKTECTAEYIKLLISTERGRMYEYLKYSEGGYGQWESLCSSLDVCRATADRYIDFYRIIRTYPRLLICGLSYETIHCLYTRLTEYLANDEDLCARLMQPLREVKITNTDITIHAHNLPAREEEQPMPGKLTAENADWTPGWQLTDEILQSQADDDEDEVYEDTNE